MTQDEKELVFSKTMARTVQGKTVRDIIRKFLDDTEKNNTAQLRQIINDLGG